LRESSSPTFESGLPGCLMTHLQWDYVSSLQVEANHFGHFRKRYNKYQRSQGTAERRIRNEGPRRTQVLHRHLSSLGQGMENHSYEPVRLQSNDSRTVQHGEQQIGKHTSLQQRSSHQGDSNRNSGGSIGVSKHGRQPHVRNARYQARSSGNDSADLTILTETHKDSREGSKTRTSISQRND
jgi:hypothetical protein